MSSRHFGGAGTGGRTDLTEQEGDKFGVCVARVISKRRPSSSSLGLVVLSSSFRYSGGGSGGVRLGTVTTCRIIAGMAAVGSALSSIAMEDVLEEVEGV